MAEKRTSNMRWVYPKPPEGRPSGAVSIVPEILVFGCQKYAEAYYLTSHRHDRSYEFVFHEQGSVTWEVAGEPFSVRAGQWFFTKPGEPHRARFDHIKPSKIWWIIIRDPAECADWFRLDDSEKGFVMQRLQQLPRVFRADKRVPEQFERLRATLEAARPEQRLYARHQALDIILGLLYAAPSKPIEPALRERIQRLVDRMSQQLDARLTVAQMAREVRVSESHFYNLFNELYGQSPYAYMEHVRIEKACAMLSAGKPVTEIAFDLGYKTSQHFSVVFKKLIGLPPHRWRKAIAGKPAAPAPAAQPDSAGRPSSPAQRGTAGRQGPAVQAPAAEPAAQTGAAT